MTAGPAGRTPVEADLAEQLGMFAREFVAELEAQGRLVEVGGAGVLERLRTQVEQWRNRPESYRAAVDTIVEDCGYPSEVAMRIAAALNRKGLLPGGGEPEPRHDRASAAAPLVPGARGAIVLHLADRGPGRSTEERGVLPGNGIAPEDDAAHGLGVVSGRAAAHGYGAMEPEAAREHGGGYGVTEPEAAGEQGRARENGPACDAGHRREARSGSGDVSDPEAEAVPEPVDGQLPRVRPAAARSRTAGWDTASARAVSVAATLQSDHLARLEAMRITADGERVTVAIKATCLADWEYWLDAIGAARNVRTRTAGHAQVAAGTLDGVAVHLTAHGVPELLQEASDAATDPFYLWGRIYDLGVGQTDRSDRVWLSLGRRQDEHGMPLLVLRGTAGPPYPLAAIVMAHGPLTPTPLPADDGSDGDGL